MSATAASCRGAVALARDDAHGALVELRRAITAWLHLDCHYEVARARVLAATALEAVGDVDGVALELAAARDAFERLGAAPDVRRIDDIFRGRTAGGLSPRELEVLRLVSRGRSNKDIAGELHQREHRRPAHPEHLRQARRGVADRGQFRRPGAWPHLMLAFRDGQH